MRTRIARVVPKKQLTNNRQGEQDEGAHLTQRHFYIWKKDNKQHVSKVNLKQAVQFSCILLVGGRWWTIH